MIGQAWERNIVSVEQAFVGRDGKRAPHLRGRLPKCQPIKTNTMSVVPNRLLSLSICLFFYRGYGVLVGYFVNHPLYTPPSKLTFKLSDLGMVEMSHFIL